MALRMSTQVALRVGAAALVALWLYLAILHRVPGIGILHIVALVAAVALAQFLPVAATRERRITFTPSLIFAGALLVGPWAAGIAGVAGILLVAWIRRGTGFWKVLVPSAIYLIATLPVAAVLSVFQLRLPITGFQLTELPELILAAFFYFAVVATPWIVDSRLHVVARRGDASAALAGDGVAFVAGLLVALLLVSLRVNQIGVGLLVFASTAAAAVLAVRIAVELPGLRKQVNAMEAIGRQAIDAQNRNHLLEQLVASAHDLVAFDNAFIWLTHKDGEHLELQASWPESAPPPVGKRVSIGEGLVGRVATRRRGIIVAGGNDPRWGPGYGAGGPKGVASVLAVPLTAGERTVGVALFGSEEQGRYGARDLHVLQSVANLVATAIENVRLHQSIRAMAVTDGLTGLTNHRRLQEVLTEEIWRAQRYGRAVSVIMCDVDSFKAYNDTYGHPQGDELLKQVAKILQQSVRAVDTVARYGGEEFCLVLPETDRSQAARMAERVRRSVAAADFPGEPDGPVVRKTMSFGVACLPDDTTDPDHLLPLADEALYRAKRSGKNQVQLARRLAVAAAEDVAWQAHR